MVGRWGMSDEIGFVNVLPADHNPFMPGDASESTRRIVDEAVKRLVDTAHARVTRLLSEQREKLDALAHALLEAETLDQEDAYGAAGVAPPPALDATMPASASLRRR
jgi:cell division protease FtsH